MDSIPTFSATATDSRNKSLQTASKNRPCPHCGKPDWCYFIGDLSVCNREQPPATDWEATSKKDAEGRTFYAPKQEKKSIRSPQVRCFWYPNRDELPFVLVERSDDGYGKKKIWQQHWDGKDWVKGLDGIKREDIPPYQYAKVKVAIAKGEPIFIVDGEPCADALWALGLAATTSIGGMGKWRDSDTQFLEGAKAVIVPDRDQPGIKDADKLSKHFPEAQWLFAYPESKAWQNLPKSGGLDVKDWIESHTLKASDILNAVMMDKTEIEAFRAILMQAESQGEPLDTWNRKPKSKSRNEYLLDKIEAHWGERLRLNEMTQQIELNGRAGELNVERAYARLARELSLDIPKQTASDFVAEIAEKYSYSPVRDYLNSLTGIEPINLDSLAERYFGTSDPLHAILLKRTLIAAVARVFKPGCKVDTLCILQGGQGTLKSTFWETLASEPYFTDNLSESNEKDEKLKLRRYWILEFSEFETAYKKKEVEQLKAFLSSRIDSLRRPYGRAIEDFPRTSIFVGTTNRQEILHDPTGERRYLVIPVSRRIPIETVKAERDAIWAAAVAAYKAGEQWWLTPKEDELLAEANQGWQSSDTWEEDILKYLELRSSCTICDILEKPLGIDIGQHGKGEQMRVSDILRRNGWVRVSKRVDGKLQRCWERVVTEVVTGVVTEVVTPQNPHPVTISGTLLPPVTTFLPNNSQNTDDTAGGDKTNNSQSKESLQNTGGNTLPSEPQNFAPQKIEPVTTSPKQGGNTPQCLQTNANKRRADTLADKMREAIANGDSAGAKEVWNKFENLPPSQQLQQRGFFWQNLEQTNEKYKANLLIFAGLLEGEKLKYVGDIEQYQGLELTAYDADSCNGVTVTCLMSDGRLTTWIPLKDLQRAQ